MIVSDKLRVGVVYRGGDREWGFCGFRKVIQLLGDRVSWTTWDVEKNAPGLGSARACSLDTFNDWVEGRRPGDLPTWEPGDSRAKAAPPEFLPGKIYCPDRGGAMRKVAFSRMAPDGDMIDWDGWTAAGANGKHGTCLRKTFAKWVETDFDGRPVIWEPVPLIDAPRSRLARPKESCTSRTLLDDMFSSLHDVDPVKTPKVRAPFTITLPLYRPGLQTAQRGDTLTDGNFTYVVIRQTEDVVTPVNCLLRLETMELVSEADDLYPNLSDFPVNITVEASS